MRSISIAAFLFAMLPSVVFAAMIEGQLASVDLTYRKITLHSGEILDLAEGVDLTPLESGQVIRATCEDGTVIAHTVEILEAAPPPQDDEPILEE